jgi:bacterial/archaeal transporter family protein
MEWILLSVLSALCLGLYDLLKKAALTDNAVPPVLLLNVLTAAGIYVPVILWCRIDPSTMAEGMWWVAPLEWQLHLLLLLKSMLVGASWTLAFFGLKHLPISIATPIRSTSPLWTIIIAVLLFGEDPSPLQWLGMMTLLGAFYLFSAVGRREGFHFVRNRWVGCMVAATVLGSISALYDKFLLQSMRLSPVTVQAWFSVYLMPVMLPLAIRWYYFERRTKPFQWRWTIPSIAVVLLLADILYFSAVSNPQALIAIVSPVRRMSVIIPFVYGILWLGEHNWRPKAICVALMLVGVILVSL